MIITPLLFNISKFIVIINVTAVQFLSLIGIVMFREFEHVILNTLRINKQSLFQIGKSFSYRWCIRPVRQLELTTWNLPVTSLAQHGTLEIVF